MKGERAGVNALLMGLIALITIVLAPLATLVLMQMMFLPYHHLRITWWHRGFRRRRSRPDRGDDLPMLLPSRREEGAAGARRAQPQAALGDGDGVLRLLAVVLVPARRLVVVPARALGRRARLSSSRNGSSGWRGSRRRFQRRSELCRDRERRRVRPVSDRLKLNDETIVGKEKLEKTKKEIASRGGEFVPTIKLDGRDLQAADLNGADLRASR